MSTEAKEEPQKSKWNIKEIINYKKKARRRIMPEDDQEEAEAPERNYAPTFSSPKSYLVSPPVSETVDPNSDKSQKVIRLARSLRIKWDLFVMSLAVWNCFYTPYHIAFNPSDSKSVAAIVIGSCIDFFFLFDIALNFRTTFLDHSTGDEVFDLRLIARNYILGKFWIDLVSSIPSDLVLIIAGHKDSSEVDLSSILFLLGILKIYRIARLNRIINFMRAKYDVKLLLRICQLLFFLLMYVHLVACAWWIIVSYDQNWVPPADQSQIFEAEATYKYWVSFYNSVMMLVGADVGPRNRTQTCFASFLIIFGALITAVMFGNMAVLMSNLNLRQTKFQENQNAVNTAMKNMKLPEKLQQTISDYLIYTEASIANLEEFQTFESLISPSLYREVLEQLYSKIISQNEIFGSSDSIKEFTVPRLHPQFCKPEELIIDQGDNSDNLCLYFIAKGDCEVSVVNEKKKEKKVGVLRAGYYFGEVALVAGYPRTASVCAKNYTTLGVLKKEDFLQLVKNHKHILSTFKEGMYTYNDHFKKFLLRMIRRVPYFKGLNRETEQELLYSLKEVYVEEGEYLIRPGVSCGDIMFVSEGNIEVTFTISDKDINSRKDSDNFSSFSVFENSVKKTTEIFPLWGNTGVEGSVHVTELEAEREKTIIGNNCVEIILDLLKTGSALGFINAVSHEVHLISAKTCKKSVLYVLEESSLKKLRIKHLDLQQNLLEVESWCKNFTPHIDDYIAVNDKKFMFNSKRNRYFNLFRGAIMRVIKENRDKKLLETPMIALMLKQMPKSSNGIRKAKQVGSMAQSVLKVSFNPRNRAKIKKLHSGEQLHSQVTSLAKTLLKHSELIDYISNCIEELATQHQLPVLPGVASSPLLGPEEPPQGLYKTQPFSLN